MARTIDLELTRAEVEVIELEARLRVVPMNDLQLSEALTLALRAKKERLDKLRAIHAAANRPKPELMVPPKPVLPKKASSAGAPTAGARPAATKPLPARVPTTSKVAPAAPTAIRIPAPAKKAGAAKHVASAKAGAKSVRTKAAPARPAARKTPAKASRTNGKSTTVRTKPKRRN